MNEQLYTPKPSRLLVPTAEERPLVVRDFKPFKTRDPRVHALIHGKPAGVRTLFDEPRATQILRTMLEAASTPEEAAEIGTFGAVALFGASGYLFCEQQVIGQGISVRAVQNRYVKLPPLLDRQTQEGGAEAACDNAVAALDTAIAYADSRFAAYVNGGESTAQAQARKLATGRAMATAAMRCAIIGAADFVANHSYGIYGDEAQLIARDACTNAMRTGREVGAETGYHPSLIQLVEPLAPFTVEMQKAASDAVHFSYREAQAAVA
ncbi:MAG: hypothetical protein U0520_05505 [Candidatus Saccharimonadales bacterium]|jgi:hypothetical protein